MVGGRTAAAEEAQRQGMENAMLQELKRRGLGIKIESDYEGRMVYEAQMEWYGRAAAQVGLQRSVGWSTPWRSMPSRCAGQRRCGGRDSGHACCRRLTPQPPPLTAVWRPPGPQRPEESQNSQQRVRIGLPKEGQSFGSRWCRSGECKGASSPYSATPTPIPRPVGRP